MESGAPEPVQLGALGVQELSELRQQLNGEVQTLVENHVALQQTAAKFAAAGQSIEFLQEKEQQGQPLMLPLTESMYVSGTLDSVEGVLLDIGTGYFVERDIAGGVDYCKRKVVFVRDKMEELAAVIKQRQGMLQQISKVLERKLEHQHQQGKAQG